ncbi:MAG: hypothetical protein P1P88_11345 [Bacteroidales bacterium]|nr:hypothetical protein [Bacteroidales bacterium]
MKKLLLIVFIAGFVGLAFAFNPAKVTTSNETNQITLLEDTTKTTKKTTATKEDCTKKSCCKTKCSSKTKSTDKPKK